MTPLLANWTIVLVGKWNVNILSPDWVGTNVLLAENINIEMILDGVGTYVKYIHENISFLPTPDKVVISVLNTEEETLSCAEEVAIRLLTKLPVTPMAATGVNFTFIEANPGARLRQALLLQDNTAISDLNYDILSTQVTRSIKFDERQMNLSLTMDASGHVRIATNFHLNTTTTNLAVAGLNGNINSLCRECQNFLSKVYDLSVEG